jgi:Na+/H+-translocating membrane pyrophosphatase
VLNSIEGWSQIGRARSSLVVGATGKTAYQMVDEVRRQSNENPGIIEGKAKLDYACYACCVEPQNTP